MIVSSRTYKKLCSLFNFLSSIHIKLGSLIVKVEFLGGGFLLYSFIKSESSNEVNSCCFKCFCFLIFLILLIFKDVYIQGIWKVWVADFTKGNSRFSICSEFWASGGTYHAQRFFDARGIVGKYFVSVIIWLKWQPQSVICSVTLMFQNMSDYFFWYTVTIACSRDARFQEFISKRGWSCTSLVTAETKEDSIRYWDLFWMNIWASLLATVSLHIIYYFIIFWIWGWSYSLSFRRISEKEYCKMHHQRWLPGQPECYLIYVVNFIHTSLK